MSSVLVPILQRQDDSKIVINKFDNCDHHHLRVLIVQTQVLFFLEHIPSLVRPIQKVFKNIDCSYSASNLFEVAIMR